jgi:glutamine phosphoribosylpyrophosphate amidotransferase
MQICAFLWVYYGYPASCYEGINVEFVRNRCGEALARADDCQIDLVAGIPDSGTGHAIGYANGSGVPYGRPFVKYTLPGQGILGTECTKAAQAPVAQSASRANRAAQTEQPAQVPNSLFPRQSRAFVLPPY